LHIDGARQPVIEENIMRLLYAAASAVLLMFPGSAGATEKPTISGPFTHQNLSIYLVHGASAPGPAPLILQEALDKGVVDVIETGSVNELKIRNKGDRPIFIQSGEIVKGGRQDRVVTVSFLLPPKSGNVPLAAFCVEQGRWSARGVEDARRFANSAEALPSREAKLAMKAPLAAAPAQPMAGADARQQAVVGGNETSERQRKVWEEIAKTQSKLSDGVKQTVTSSVSNTSLQLSLENEKLQAMRAPYVAALEKLGASKDDVVGYVFAVNGRINSGDIYPSNALFRKMWGKLLAASVTEAIGEIDAAANTPAPPSMADIENFLTEAEKPVAASQEINGFAKQDVRDADRSLFVGARTVKGDWIHRNYLVK
jgi:hypothetical protein